MQIYSKHPQYILANFAPIISHALCNKPRQHETRDNSWNKRKKKREGKKYCQRSGDAGKRKTHVSKYRLVNWKPFVIIIAERYCAPVNAYAPQTMSFLNEISVTRVSESRINARKET